MLGRNQTTYTDVKAVSTWQRKDRGEKVKIVWYCMFQRNVISNAATAYIISALNRPYKKGVYKMMWINRLRHEVY